MVLCLPLVIHNTGAAPIVVLAMRLRFSESPNTNAMAWQNKRSALPGVSSDRTPVAPFAIVGRAVEQGNYEFSQDDPPYRPTGDRTRVIVEAKLAHKKTFQAIIDFDLNIKRARGRGDYIAYGNDEIYDAS